MLEVSFLGDISLNNIYNKFYKENTNPFLNVEHILRNSNFNIGNLECMSEGNQGENILKHPRLKTQQNTLKLLSKLNLQGVSLAHNHTYDNLKDGYETTIESLNSQKINYLGVGLSKEEAEKPLIIDENGVRLGFLNFVNENTNPKMPNKAEIFLNYLEINEVENQILKIKKKVDHVIVLLHWGGRVEEGFYPDKNQPLIARKMIEAGADLIIGGHSHTVQPFEIYKGKYIFYSLGNFCFDDILQDQEIFEIGRYRKRKTIIPTVIFEKEKYSVNISHVKNKEGFIIMNNSLFRKFILNWRNTLFFFMKNSEFLWKIYFWHLKKIVPIKMFFFEANEGFLKKIVRLDFRRVIRYIRK